MQGTTTMNSPNTEILHPLAEQWTKLFKAVTLYGWMALNCVSTLAVHLAVAVCVLHWRVGSDPGCVTGLAQNCHSSRVLVQATLHLHANTSH